MKVTINNKVYDFSFNAQIGAYYRYEVTWGTSFADDNELHGGQVSLMRLSYAILQNSNPKTLEVTFEEFVSAIADDQFIDLCKYINERFEYFAQEAQKANEATEDEGEVKNV